MTTPHDKTLEALRQKLEKMPKTDRGISWQLRNWNGSEEMTVYGATANCLKWIFDNTEALISAISHTPIEAGNGGDGWLDIASAPTRSHILLALPNGVVVEGYWGAARYNRKTKDYDYAWVTHPSSGDIKPTNWRPLPAPPSTTSNEGREKA